MKDSIKLFLFCILYPAASVLYVLFYGYPPLPVSVLMIIVAPLAILL